MGHMCCDWIHGAIVDASHLINHVSCPFSFILFTYYNRFSGQHGGLDNGMDF